MTVETQQNQAVYGSSDVAVTLNVQESTLRKYCLILEKADYEFLKNEHGHRAFFDQDIIVLKKLIDLKKDSDMTLEQSAKAVIAWKNGGVIAEGDTEEKRYIMRYNDLLEEFKQFKEQQMDFNKELIAELKKQSEYIENRLEERDRVLLLSVKESMEARREVAAATSKKWWQFWR